RLSLNTDSKPRQRERRTMSEGLSQCEWENRYQQGQTPWDLGTVSPPFVDVYNRRRLKPGRLAIPGSGPGHEAVYFASRGFDVTAFDVAPSACRALEARAR